jgi:thioredoxin reductase
MKPVLPVVVIGAGPVGLAAAAHLLARGLTPVVLEAGPSVGSGMQRWSHVRMFSPWEYTVDKVAARLLAHEGWSAPDPAVFPTGGEVVQDYLLPLAATTAMAPHLRTGSRVTAVTRHRRDRMKNGGRDDAPFLVRYEDSRGEHELLAQAVIDASGTIENPNPLGAAGIPAIGERALREHIRYGIPDVTGADRQRYAGKRVLVVGSGHSALNVLRDLARLAAEAPSTRVQWAVRQPSLQRILGGGENDQLKERGRLGSDIGRLVSAGLLKVATRFQLERLERTADGLVATSGDVSLDAVDEIVAVTGFRPELGLLSELRIALDPDTQSPSVLAPLIDPNLHSCGSVRPHGAVELSHPDPNFYIVGMKSYGRAPTFLLLTGYEQVRSVVAAIAGDWDAARRVELVLPETGVCITQFADEDESATACSSGSCAVASGPSVHATQAAAMDALVPTAASSCCSAGALPGAHEAGRMAAIAEDTASCCGGPARSDAAACCLQDELARVAGATGCGCSAPTVPAAPVRRTACCG